VRLARPLSSLPEIGASILAEVAARRAIADIACSSPKKRLQRETIRDERARFARDLHDGALQGLTGVALQLEAASRLIASDVEAARAHIQAAADSIAAQQRELRLMIQGLKPVAAVSLVSVCELGAALEELRNRIAKAWRLRIELVVSGDGAIFRELGDNIFHIVEEGLANIARHAHAQVADVSVGIMPDRVCIRVSDDGCGFAFHGRYDLAALIARGLGPASLLERVAALRGEFILTSGLAGSRVDISLPVGRDGILSCLTVEHSRE
jgi:signal transduction histidine kinase